jgi:hypothetical protein
LAYNLAMPSIEFPQALKNLLDGRPLQAAVRAYADQAGHIFADNKLDFFPDYTDHGTEHINRVLASAVELIPSANTQRLPPAFTDKDAAVLIGATLLHDIAMHLRPVGFLALVGTDSRFKPLPWFKQEQQGHKADRLWRELWLDYEREAKRFSDRKLADIIGPASVRQGWTFNGLPKDPGEWQHNHKLVLGEFIRRHHARLAHEIAHYGFPGLEAGAGEHQFAALAAPGHPLQSLADLIGLAARSHGMNLRVCQAYLGSRYPRTPQPMGCAVLYPMALLRVADYLQIDRQRTPPALLKLRDPQSPVSLQEWQKHLAVLSISPADDPRGKMVTISPNVSHAVYLQLRELLASLQAEMDHATAVLDEAYGTRKDLGLDALGLATRRVHSNLDEPSFRDSLPYVPERTGYSTDPNLLTLLVEPLYGKEPGVGVRELMQNSVDAVRELHAWCEAHGKRVEELDLPDQEADVQIDFIQREDGSWFLRCTDKGIGMTADTIQNYFLRAGASFRNSPEWTKEFVDDEGKPKVLRAGRFGIGVFAIFLLGPRFRLWARHVTADETQGYYLEAEVDSREIEIQVVDRPTIGTTLAIDITDESAEFLGLKGKFSTMPQWRHLDNQTDWFCWNWPKVTRRVLCNQNEELIEQRNKACFNNKRPVSPEWFSIYPENFEAVYWTFKEFPEISCNGLRIGTVHGMIVVGGWPWPVIWPQGAQLKVPNIAIVDNSAALPVNIKRDGLLHWQLSFATELGRDLSLCFIAHALVCGPASRIESLDTDKGIGLHPLVGYKEAFQESLNNSLLRWCSTEKAFVPSDSWLYSLLHTDGCALFGAVGSGYSGLSRQPDKLFGYAQEDLGMSAIFWESRTSGGAHGLIKLGEWLESLVKRNFSFLDDYSIDIEGLVSWGSGIRSSSVLSPDLSSQHWHLSIPGNETMTTHRTYAAYGTDSLDKTLDLKTLIAAMESYGRDDFLFFFNLKTIPKNPQPTTLIAKLWNECLGPNPIPFDPVTRQALIERGRQHPELRRHIEAWEEMKRTGSKWVVGDGD